MSMSRRAAAAALALPLALGLVAGCSGSTSATSGSTGTSGAATSAAAVSDDPAEIYKQAKASIEAASSMHVSGSVDVGSDTPVTLDLAGTVDGKNQQLTMTEATVGEVTLLFVDGKTYLKLTSKIIDALGSTSSDQSAAVGKWAELTSDQVASMGAEISLNSLVEGMFSESDISAADAQNTNVERSTLDGVDVFVLTDKSATSDGSQVIVTADGTARLVKLVGPASTKSELTFTQWNEVEKFTAPAASEITTVPGL